MRIRIFLIFIFILSCLPCGAAQHPISITVSPESHISSGSVLLKDIAVIKGGDNQTRKKFENLFISQAPYPGQHIRLSRLLLETKLRRVGSIGRDFNLDAPQTMKIYPQNSIISGRDIIRAATDFIIQQEGDYLRPAGSGIPKPITVPPGKVSYQCSIPDEPADKPLVLVKVFVDGKECGSGEVRFIRNYTSKPTGAINNPSTEQKFEKKQERNKEESVRSGSPITLQFIRNGLMISINGTALESGYPGDRIRVKIDGEKKKYEAVISDKTTAVVKI